MASPFTEIEVDDRVVKVTNPDRVYFPRGSGETKLDLVEYYLSVGDGIVNALCERPCMLHRFPKGLAGDKVHQKRLPAGAPPWVETVQLFFPRWKPHRRRAVRHRARPASSGRCRCRRSSSTRGTAAAPTPRSPTSGASTSTPGPECDWATVQRVAHVAHEVLDELGAVGFPKTSGGKGMHIYVRIPPDHGFKDVRRARSRSPARSSGGPGAR